MFGEHAVLWIVEHVYAISSTGIAKAVAGYRALMLGVV